MKDIAGATAKNVQLRHKMESSTQSGRNSAAFRSVSDLDGSLQTTLVPVMASSFQPIHRPGI
jgi:hypothetical protein